ncbi:MAG: DUF4124 domain-containing protein [Nitrospira sp. BO4]|jgi:hypothetical protein|nr:DUF4124 domain-containing protein [Nitrospira sp. BO4]
MSYREYRSVISVCLAAAFAVWHWGVVEVHAATVYSYIDDQGTPVFTDSPETIPEKYRAKVKTHERPDPVKKSPSVVDTVRDTVKEQVKGFGFQLPSVDMKNPSWTQSPILTYAGIAAMVLLIIMYLSKNSPMIRLLAMGLLIVIAIGTPVLMYTSDGGPMDTMKKKAAASGQAQQDRLQQVPQ